MAENNNTKFAPSYEDYYDRKLYDKFYLFVGECHKLGVTGEHLNNLLFEWRDDNSGVRSHLDGGRGGVVQRWKCHLSQWKKQLMLVAVVLIIGLVWNDAQPLQSLNRVIFNSKCILQNNFFVMEVSRPVTDCSICRGVDSVVVLFNATRQTFAQYAYSGRPVIVRGATASWTALHTFNFDFFKKVYQQLDGAYDSVEQECQFFPFRTDFVTLRDVFAMSADRARGLGSEKTWYVGWSNCHPGVARVLRQHYTRPHFLPSDSESSAIDWIFMGWPGLGASIHLDFVQRPSWQAQISGEKLWRLFPTPECEHVCNSFNITVHKGDIVLIDTNRWYHDTYIDHGEMSITIGSEYD